ncbi:MAG: outer membrane beta-barrel protein [Muribaculaceae bacterium]|nr:outer membrane beta-barrel protein [Muribaculaceae bacterium]
MKKTFLAIILATLSMGLNAQEFTVLLDNPDNKAHFGLRASLDISCPSITGDGLCNGAGFSVGGVYNIPLWKNLYFEPGVGLFYNTWGMNDAYLKAYVDAVLGNQYGYDYDASYRKLGLRIPFLVGYHFDFTDKLNVAVFTGPELNIGINHKLKLSAKEGSTEVKATTDLYDEGSIKRSDVAWKFGVGVNYEHYYLGISGDLGMVNLMKDAPNGYSYHMNTVAFTVGYNF